MFNMWLRYDLDDDDKITREELLAVLHMMVGANISSDQVWLANRKSSVLIPSKFL